MNSATTRTSIESRLRRDYWLMGGVLAAAIALCWAWIVPAARDMYGEMTGLSAWMMTDNWDFTHLALLFVMWVVMMAGMMLPSIAPVLRGYAQAVRQRAHDQRVPARLYAFAGGYVLTWTAFSLAATVLQRLLANLLLLTPMMEPANRTFGAGLIIAAGAYQLTPFKRSCLKSCRSPVQSFADQNGPPATEGFRLGLQHGLHCVGCCWALMLLLFVGGVMNLWCIIAVTIFVLFERLASYGANGVRLSGMVLVALGIWYAMQ